MKLKPFWKGLNKAQYEMAKMLQLGAVAEFFTLLLVGLFRITYLLYLGLWVYLIGNLIIYKMLFNEQTSKGVKNEEDKQ